MAEEVVTQRESISATPVRPLGGKSEVRTSFSSRGILAIAVFVTSVVGAGGSLNSARDHVPKRHVPPGEPLVFRHAGVSPAPTQPHSSLMILHQP